MAKIDRVGLHSRINGFFHGVVYGDGFFPIVSAYLGRRTVYVAEQQGNALGGPSNAHLLLPRAGVHDGETFRLVYYDCESHTLRSVEHTLRVKEQEPKGPGGVTQPRGGGLSTSKVGRGMALSATARKR